MHSNRYRDATLRGPTQRGQACKRRPKPSKSPRSTSSRRNPVSIPLPWERLLWSARPTRLLPRLHLRGERYVLTDMRVVRISRTGVDELATCDIGEVRDLDVLCDRLEDPRTSVQPAAAGTSSEASQA